MTKTLAAILTTLAVVVTMLVAVWAVAAEWQTLVGKVEAIGFSVQTMQTNAQIQAIENYEAILTRRKLTDTEYQRYCRLLKIVYKMHCPPNRIRR